MVLLVTIVFASSMLMAVNPASAANPTITEWIPDQRIGVSNDYEVLPVIAAANNGSLFAAFNQINSTTNEWEIKVARSNDGGVTWTVVYTQRVAGYWLLSPSIAVDTFTNDVYVAFERLYSGSDYDIWLLRYSPATGWTLELVDNSASNDQHPTVVCEYDYGTSNYVYLVWERFESYEDSEIIWSRSTDHGDTWPVQVALTANTVTDDQPSITYGGDGCIYVAHRYYNPVGPVEQINVLRSTDRGGSWQTKTDITGTQARVHDPSIAAVHGNGVVFVAWTYEFSPTDYDIYYSFSSNHGISWDSPTGLATSSLSEKEPTLTVDGMGRDTDYIGYIHAMYRKIETAGSRTNGIYYTKALFSAPYIWSFPVQIVDDVGYATDTYIHLTDRPITTTKDTVPVVVWTDARGTRYAVRATTLGGKYTIDTSPSGLRLDVDGVIYNGPASFYWAYMSTHTIGASTPQGSHSFVRWSDEGAQTHSVIAQSTSAELRIAYFTPTLTLNLSPNPVARGSKLTISGQLTPGKATSISLYYRTSTSNPWALAATLPTNTAGAYSVSVTVPTYLTPGTYDLVAVWYNSANNRYAASDVKKLTIT
jgi:hypothetical protein